jgi:hypothetical protein
MTDKFRKSELSSRQARSRTARVRTPRFGSATERAGDASAVEDYKSKLGLSGQRFPDAGRSLDAGRAVLDALTADLKSKLVAGHDRAPELDPVDRGDERDSPRRQVDTAADQDPGGLSKRFEDEHARHDG